MIVCHLARILGEYRMSQDVLVQKTGLSRMIVNKLYYDQWDTVDRRVLQQICGALDIQPGELLTWEPAVSSWKEG